MKKFRQISAIFFFLFLICNSVFAMEFKDVDFVDGTLLDASKSKYISTKNSPDLRFYVSFDRTVEMIDKKNSNNTVLFETAPNPVLVYIITTKDKNCLFYAILDRNPNHSMETTRFKLVGSLSDTDSFKEYLSLDDLRAAGWQSDALQMRVEDKNLFIDGITRDKRTPHNIVTSFLLTWNEDSQTFSITNI